MLTSVAYLWSTKRASACFYKAHKNFSGHKALQVWLILKMNDLQCSREKVTACHILWVDGWVERSVLSCQRNAVPDKYTGRTVLLLKNLQRIPRTAGYGISSRKPSTREWPNPYSVNYTMSGVLGKTSEQQRGMYRIWNHFKL